jgi:two-component system sensor histidine kinase KdpD
MQRYIEKLLDMTRLDAGSIEAHIEPLDPAEIASTVVKRAEKLADGRSLQLHVEPGLPMVTADATLIDQALFNLVENALMHGRSGDVVLAAKRAGAGVVFEVMDEGPGLAPGDELRIFERFARGGSSAAGTGLGLAIVKGFAGLMGATASARNRSDRAGLQTGALFSIEFPAKAGL